MSVDYNFHSRDGKPKPKEPPKELDQTSATPKERMIMNLMEEVISILSTCKDLSDPEFSMYETMKHAVDTEVYYPLYD